MAKKRRTRWTTMFHLPERQDLVPPPNITTTHLRKGIATTDTTCFMILEFSN